MRVSVSFTTSMPVSNLIDQLVGRYVASPIGDQKGKRLNKAEILAAMAGFFSSLDDEALIKATKQGLDAVGIKYTERKTDSEKPPTRD